MPDALDEDALRTALHGEVVGYSSEELRCDYHVDTGTAAVSIESLVLCECCKPVTLTGLTNGVRGSVGWTTDAIRCADHAIDELVRPTDGYAEALVRVGIVDQGGRLTVDATRLTVLDFSPHDEGREPVPLPGSIVGHRVAHGDWGIFRWARLRQHVEGLRAAGRPEDAADIEARLDDADPST